MKQVQKKMKTSFIWELEIVGPLCQRLTKIQPSLANDITFSTSRTITKRQMQPIEFSLWVKDLPSVRKNEPTCKPERMSYTTLKSISIWTRSTTPAKTIAMPCRLFRLTGPLRYLTGRWLRWSRKSKKSVLEITKLKNRWDWSTASSWVVTLCWECLPRLTICQRLTESSTRSTTATRSSKLPQKVLTCVKKTNGRGKWFRCL